MTSSAALHEDTKIERSVSSTLKKKEMPAGDTYIARISCTVIGEQDPGQAGNSMCQPEEEKSKKKSGIGKK